MTPRFFDNVDDTIRSLKNPSSGRHYRSKNDFIPAPSSVRVVSVIGSTTDYSLSSTIDTNTRVTITDSL